jgi:Rv2525c-like, glycoside hydrolase-like domain
MRRVALCVLALVAVLPASSEAKTVHFGGRVLSVPDGWPVIRLAEQPHACVRLDRKAVYLGAPSPDQRCSADAIGRRRAILVDPGARARGARARARASRVPAARISAASDYTGLGFDACTAPSRRSMSAWASSPYRAIGVYVGGENRGCSQPNLTASWVAEQTAAGWSLIPTYVGLQAPTSSCTSCATLSSSTTTAARQGGEAAEDAVADAQLAGIGEGSPIYFDMESYSRTSSATNATLTFLAAWTTRLHALGYVSGVYSSSASGIADLASRLGTTYQQPDDLWIANWNGRANTADPYLPASAWSDQQRIHQYRGGHDETYGGVTINIDNNYVEGATAGAGAPGEDPRGSFEVAGSPAAGQVQIAGWAFDPSAPLKPLSIRAYLGGKPDEGASRYELGPVANLERADLLALFPRAGAAHGFDVSFPVVGSGRQRLCVYARDIGPGADKLLGCRRVGVRIPVSLLAMRVGGQAVHLTLRCDWPAGTQCPGQLLLRASVRERRAVRRRGRVVMRTRVVRQPVGRAGFHLFGGGTQTFRLSLNSRGRELGAGPGRPWTQLLVAIPGGRLTKAVRLR